MKEKKEVKRMEGKAILVWGLALLMFLTFIAPVMAAPNANAWHTVLASQTSNFLVSYAQLTDYCINVWGLSENPYPTYPVGVRTAYYIFTLMIGDEVYQGVSCSSYTGSYDPVTKVLTLKYDSVWYLGDYGKTNARMNQGFEGTVDIQCYNYHSGVFDYFTGQFNYQGFQRFNHQSLILTVDDSRISSLAAGICEVLGSRDKM
jgi:hypothetical protein